MLLKNRVPSLKSETKSERKISNCPENTDNCNVSQVIHKNEEINSEISSTDNIALRSNVSQNANKYGLVELNNICSYNMKNNIDVLNDDLVITGINIKNSDESVIDINIDPLLSSSIIEKDYVNIDFYDEPSISSNKSTYEKKKTENEIKRIEKRKASPIRKKKPTVKKIKKSDSELKIKVQTNIPAPKSLDSGVYVECDLCHKTRYLKDVLDPSEIPGFWTCEMEKSKTLSCDVPQENFQDSIAYFINNNYTLGSVVWAKAPGFCWWPAIIDDDPDLRLFYWCFDNSDDVSHYHVTFLDDDVSRSWVMTKDIKVFHGKADMTALKFGKPKKDYTKTINKAVERAEECLKLSLQECLDKFSFAVRYTGKPNLWTSQSFQPKKKTSKSVAALDETPSQSRPSSSQTKKQSTLPVSSSASSSSSQVCLKPIKMEKSIGDLNKTLSSIEQESESLVILSQQTKHDLIMKNNIPSNKENKYKTNKNIPKKKPKKPESWEE